MDMNVNLTPQLDEMLRQKVGSGLYTSASEVIQEALRRMGEKHSMRLAKLAHLRQDVRAGLDSGPSDAWDPALAKSDGRARRATKALEAKAPAAKAWRGASPEAAAGIAENRDWLTSRRRTR